MSRGLSQQQRRILGLAYAFNIQLNGGTYTRRGLTTPAGNSESGAPPDFFPWMLEHYIAGIPFKKAPIWTRNRRDAFYEPTSAMRCAKASLRRAVTTLWNKDYLVYHTWKKQFPGPSILGNIIAHGYVLAPSYVDLGKDNIVDVGDVIETVCQMLEQTGRGNGLWWRLAYDERMEERIRGIALANRTADPVSVIRPPRGGEVTDAVSVTNVHACTKVTINPDDSLTAESAA